MTQRSAKLAGWALSLGFLAYGAPARALDWSYPYYYDYYDAGYDYDYTNDWYYDYYDYGLDNYDAYYPHYDGYDYDADAFDWEEDGLFE